MDNVTWLIASNKGGAGKSIVAKSLVEWLGMRDVPVIVVDGDMRTPDVYATFDGKLPAFQFDLGEEAGWRHFSDFLCNDELAGHVVTNLPDGISERAIQYFQRMQQLANGFGFTVKPMFVMNHLPDGLHLFSRMAETFSKVMPVKNLFFGHAADFAYFDTAYGSRFPQHILFPKMKPSLMQVIRESNLTLSAFIAQSSNADCNFTYAKIAAADWRDSMLDALDDVLLGE